MTTLDLIQSKLLHLDEPTLQQIYTLIEQLSPNSNPRLISQLRQIQRDTLSEQSALDAAGDLVGCVEGPSDLSTNKSYMAGFGQSLSPVRSLIQAFWLRSLTARTPTISGQKKFGSNSVHRL